MERTQKVMVADALQTQSPNLGISLIEDTRSTIQRSSRMDYDIQTDAERVIREDLEYAAGRGFRTNWHTRWNIELGTPHAGRVASERQPLFIPMDVTVGVSRAFSTLLQSEGFISYYGIPLLSKGELKGVLEIYHRKPLPAAPPWRDFVETLAEQTTIAIDNASLFANLQRSNGELTIAYDTTLEGWSRAMDLRDKESEGHTERVVELSLQLARAMGIPEAEWVHIRRGALLHDIGKMGVPDRILLKDGELSDDEWTHMRQHPVYAYDLLSPIAFLHEALDIPYCHHEKWDGTGYARGLKGEQIPLAARLFAVVDVWDALRRIARIARPGRPRKSVSTSSPCGARIWTLKLFGYFCNWFRVHDRSK